MIVNLDSSAVLRRLLGQPDAIGEWNVIERAVVSELVEVECLRTLDRLRHEQSVASAKLVALRETVFRLSGACEVVPLSRSILQRAALPLPTVMGTLDAIHLTTALLWQETFDTPLTMATHNKALATGSRAFGLPVIGT